MRNVLRWILLVPATFMAWHVALLIGLLLYSYVESFCPPSEMVSGVCTADWFRQAAPAIFCFGAALAAVLIILVVAVTAPFYKIEVVWITFLIGSAVALGFAVAAEAWLEFASAVTAGLVSATATSQVIRKNASK